MPTEKLVYKSGAWVLYYGRVADIAAPINAAPVASAVITRYTGDNSYRIDVDASGSTDSDGTITKYEVDFGNSAIVTRTTPLFNNFVYGSAGTYTVKVTVTDNDGATDTWQQTITITAPVVVVPPTTYSPFEIGTVKPSAANVGTGLLRAKPTTAINTMSGSGSFAGGTYTNGVVTLTGTTKDVWLKAKQVKLNGNLAENCIFECVTALNNTFFVVSTGTSTARFCDITCSYSFGDDQGGNGWGGMGTIEYCDVSQFSDLCDPYGTGTAVIQGNYLHDMQFAIDNVKKVVNYVKGTGPHNGEKWWHDDGVQMNTTTGSVNIIGNTIIAEWSTTLGDLPNPTEIHQLAAIMCNNCVTINLDDNWLTGGEFTVNADGLGTGTANLRRNKWGTSATKYFAIMPASHPRVNIFAGTSDQNVLESTGAAAPIFTH